MQFSQVFEGISYYCILNVFSLLASLSLEKKDGGWGKLLQFEVRHFRTSSGPFLLVPFLVPSPFPSPTSFLSLYFLLSYIKALVEGSIWVQSTFMCWFLLLELLLSLSKLVFNIQTHMVLY